MDKLEVHETGKLPRDAKVIIGIPDAGLVGLISASHLIESLSMEEVASFDSEAFPPIVVVHDGEPKSPMRAYSKGDLVVVISEIAIQLPSVREVVRDLVSWIDGMGGALSISLSGAPVPNRVDIDTPKVYGVSINIKDDLLSKIGVDRLQEVMLVGPYAAVLEACRKAGTHNLTLLAQSHLQYPDPGAAAEALKAASGIIGRKIDVQPLMEKAEEIRVRLRDVMRSTEKVMRESGKEREYELPSMYV